MIWLLSGYKRAGRGALVSEDEIGLAQTAEIESLFDGQDDEPLMSSEVTTLEQLEFVRGLVGRELDTKRLRYFIERIATEPNETILSKSGETWYPPPRTLPAFLTLSAFDRIRDV